MRQLLKKWFCSEVVQLHWRMLGLTGALVQERKGRWNPSEDSMWAAGTRDGRAAEAARGEEAPHCRAACIFASFPASFSPRLSKTCRSLK